MDMLSCVSKSLIQSSGRSINDGGDQTSRGADESDEETAPEPASASAATPPPVSTPASETAEAPEVNPEVAEVEVGDE